MMKQLFIGLMILSLFNCSGEEEAGSSKSQVDSLRTSLQRSETRVDSLQRLRQSREHNSWFNAFIEGRVLKQMGIDDPEAYIEKSLRNKPELIPLEPTLGGTMRFVNVQVLGSHWVIAEYEDGHIMGRTIYEYETGQDGSIQFSVVASTHENN